MEDKIIEVLKALLAITTNTKAHWQVADQPDSYFVKLGKNMIVFYKEQITDSFGYRISVMNETGKYVYTKLITPEMESLYTVANDLFKNIVINDDASSAALQEILDSINSQ